MKTPRNRFDGASTWPAKKCAPSRSTITSSINDDVDACVERLRAIILAERARPDAMSREVAAIVSSFGPAADRR